jgi:hypothetical protein
MGVGGLITLLAFGRFGRALPRHLVLGDFFGSAGRPLKIYIFEGNSKTTNPVVAVFKNYPTYYSTFFYCCHPYKDAMHIILLRMVIMLDSSIITSYAMLMPSSR